MRYQDQGKRDSKNRENEIARAGKLDSKSKENEIPRSGKER